jgi:hypothetical protein
MVNGFAHFRSVVKNELVGLGTLKHFCMLESLASLGTVPDGMADKLAGPPQQTLVLTTCFGTCRRPWAIF